MGVVPFTNPEKTQRRTQFVTKCNDFSFIHFELRCLRPSTGDIQWVVRNMVLEVRKVKNWKCRV